MEQTLLQVFGPRRLCSGFRAEAVLASVLGLGCFWAQFPVRPSSITLTSEANHSYPCHGADPASVSGRRSPSVGFRAGAVLASVSGRGYSQTRFHVETVIPHFCLRVHPYWICYCSRPGLFRVEINGSSGPALLTGDGSLRRNH